MQNRGQLILGAVLVLLGLMALIGTIFDVDVWAFCFPVGLILLGVWLVMRPRMAEAGTGTEVMLLGDISRRGSWAVKNEEIWLGISDVDLDMTGAVFQPGETKIRVYGFVGDVEIIVPRSVAVSARALGFVVDADLPGRDLETVLAPVEVTTDDYATTETRLRIEMLAFVSELKVRRV